MKQKTEKNKIIELRANCQYSQENIQKVVGRGQLFSLRKEDIFSQQIDLGQSRLMVKIDDREPKLWQDTRISEWQSAKKIRIFGTLPNRQQLKIISQFHHKIASINTSLPH